MTREEIIDNWKAKIKEIDDSRIAIIYRLNEVGKHVPTDAERTSKGLDVVRLHEISSYLTYTQEYGLQLYADPPKGGTVYGSGDYPVGTNVEISAKPNTRYIFKKWSDGNIWIKRRIMKTDVPQTLSAHFNKRDDKSMLVWLPLNEDFLDHSGNDNEIQDIREGISISSDVQVGNKIRNVCRFDGSVRSGFSIKDSGLFKFSQNTDKSFTLHVWFYTSAYKNASNKDVINPGDSRDAFIDLGGKLTTNPGSTSSESSNFEWVFGIRQQSEVGNIVECFVGIRLEALPPLNRWNHYVAIYDDNNHKSIVYMNGSKIGEKENPGGYPFIDQEVNIYIGINGCGQTEYFNGYMFDFKLFNYALSENTIREMYHEYFDGEE